MAVTTVLHKVSENFFLRNPFELKAESLQFNHNLITSFQIHCGCVQKRRCKNGVTVHILLNLTV